MGSILGGVVGLALGGPLGAIAGAALGHGLGEQVTGGARTGSFAGPGTRRPNPHEQAQAAFFLSTFSMLAKMARADGRVTESEIALTRSFMRNELQLDPQAEQLAINVFRAAKESPTPFEEFARQFYSLFHREAQMLHAMVDMLVRLAMADGQLHPEERRLLEHAAETFGIDLRSFENIVGTQSSDFSRHYATLGLQSEATFAEVKSAYRKKVTEYHPDKVIAKGLPDEFIHLAETRFREIQEAYEAIEKKEGR
jgi:DnaJ like chaperone protein